MIRSACRIRVTGLVQGVGFRPHVWRVAHETGISGWVRNDSDGVEIAAEGDALPVFLKRLEQEAPPLARIDRIETRPATLAHYAGFTIAETQSSWDGSTRAGTDVGPDTAVCADCLAEMFDPANRRYRHAFITCTHCGPRYTVTRSLPYDRPQTSLAPFPLCPECAREYVDPGDRRFHAQTTCCLDCGPRLRLRDAQGTLMAGDAIATTLRLLKEGAIVAIKGLGGFHLACDATNADAVARLRQRKAREEKPFAVMLADIARLRRFAEPSDAERALLNAPERPVVLLAKRQETDARLPGVAPGMPTLGVMLPYTPVHHLLFHDAPHLVLVMTSANPGGEPIVIDNDEALERLSGIADAFLDHDRDILVRCDDSVVYGDRNGDGGGDQSGDWVGERGGDQGSHRFIRRARGYTPRPIRLPSIAATNHACVLALGGWFKNTVCVTRGDQAFVSQHIGDLDNVATLGFLEDTVAHLLDILDIAPTIVAHDRHPDFASTRFAARFAAEHGLKVLAVQHHHAHIAAVLAEHSHQGPALGLALDGIGLGDDGRAWGGELLRVSGAGFRRLGHLDELQLPGGDRAAREPWRMAAAALHRLGRASEIEARFADQPGAPTIRRLLDSTAHAPPTSSCGRWFDAAAGLLGIKPVMAYEGQAAMMLEALAAESAAVEPMAGGWTIEADRLGFWPLLATLADMDAKRDLRERARGAALFHATLAAGFGQWLLEAAEREKIDTVALSGGCFLNRRLSTALHERLSGAGLTVLTARQLPANDGGLSLGQAWIALQTMEN